MTNLLNHADVICAAASRALSAAADMRQLERAQYYESAKRQIRILYEPWLIKVYFGSPHATVLTRVLKISWPDIRQTRNLGGSTVELDRKFRLVKKWLERIGKIYLPNPGLHPDDIPVLHNADGARLVDSQERQSISEIHLWGKKWRTLIDVYSGKLRPQLIRELRGLSESSIQDLDSRLATIKGEKGHLATDDQLTLWLEGRR